MKLIHKILFMTGLVSMLLVSCNDDEYGPRKESSPVIVSAAVNPSTFTYGDSITLTASITDPVTNLAGLAYEVISEDKVLASGDIPIGGASHDVVQSIFVPLVENQGNNTGV